MCLCTHVHYRRGSIFLCLPPAKRLHCATLGFKYTLTLQYAHDKMADTGTLKSSAHKTIEVAADTFFGLALTILYGFSPFCRKRAHALTQGHFTVIHHHAAPFSGPPPASCCLQYGRRFVHTASNTGQRPAKWAEHQ